MGTSSKYKLPFIIGTREYEAHPYAGVVFMNSAYEQTNFVSEELLQLEADKAKEAK